MVQAVCALLPALPAGGIDWVDHSGASALILASEIGRVAAVQRKAGAARSSTARRHDPLAAASSSWLESLWEAARARAGMGRPQDAGAFCFMEQTAPEPWD
jgi:hypothetical protein